MAPLFEHTGSQVMTGSRCSRAAASYEADRALFMFLSAPIISSHPIRQAAEALVATPRLASSWSQNLLGKVDEEHAGRSSTSSPAPKARGRSKTKKLTATMKRRALKVQKSEPPATSSQLQTPAIETRAASDETRAASD